MIIKPKIRVEDLGKCDFTDSWDFQTKKLEHLKLLKKQQSELVLDRVHSLIICEHLPVYTLGKSGSKENLLISDENIEEEGYQFYKINRGGDITYHGPGQLTVYPILDLDYFFHDVHKYVRLLEEVVIRTLRAFKIEAGREDDFTGVWIQGENKRKICAIGVHMSRWVTMHGFALNVNTALKHFENIVPCGIADRDKTVTNMAKEVGVESIDQEEVKKEIVDQFGQVFEAQMISSI